MRGRLRADRARVVVRPRAEDAHGPLPLGDGAARVTGRVDRVDVGPGGAAIVRDYKGRKVVGGAKWADELQLQVALYLLAVRELLGLRAGRRALPAARRAASSAPAGSCATACRAATRAPTSSTTAAFGAALEAARALAARTAADLHAGRLAPCPERCSSRGCRYPGICRGGEPTREVPA